MPDVGEVFVVGGLPTITYYARPAFELEGAITEYLADRHSFLSLSGPTKSGKTVLLKTVVAGALWVSGGRTRSMDDVWGSLADSLGLFPDESLADSIADGSVGTRSGRAGVAVLGGEISHSETQDATRSSGRQRRRPLQDTVAEALRETRGVVVVDDFHYMTRPTQTAFIQAFRDLVFDGVGAILASVPHRRDDAVRAEVDVVGRVERIDIPPWEHDELATIGQVGFEALHLPVVTNVIDRLVSQSLSSPYLMQSHCRRLARSGDTATEPGDEFFRTSPIATERAAYLRLVRGPHARTDRLERRFADGSTGDIYQAVLRAIAATGPRPLLRYEELRQALSEVLDEDPPQRNQVTYTLEQLARIAREEIDGEPVLDWDGELALLNVVDPFFAYFLRWGSLALQQLGG
jgi:hypothetical protein